MGEEKLDNAVYLIRGLYDLADMARSRDRATERWATGIADAPRALRPTWWDQASIQYADSLRAGRRVQQQHWIGVTPMEAELTLGGRAPRLAPAEHAAAAWPSARAMLQRHGPLNRGLFHTGCAGRPGRQGRAQGLLAHTAIKAVGDGNYGAEQRRYTTPTGLEVARRAAWRAAGGPPLAATQNAATSPVLDLPLDVHAGLGPLRHRVAGDPPAARRAPALGTGRLDIVPRSRRSDADRGRASGSATAAPPTCARSAAAAATQRRSRSRTSTGSPTCASARRSRPARRSTP